MLTLANLIDDIGSNPAGQYPQVVKYALFATAGLIVLHLLIALARGKGQPRPRWWMIGRVVYLGMVATVAILGSTAFYSVLAHGAMHGWALLLHLVGAGGFVVAFALVAVAWAPWNHCCEKAPAGGASACSVTPTGLRDLGDHSSPPQSSAGTGDQAPARLRKFAPLTKLCFWLILISGVATAGTMLLSMLPIMGTDEMKQMLDVHRYSGLVLVIATAVHFYTVILGKLGRI